MPIARLIAFAMIFPLLNGCLSLGVYRMGQAQKEKVDIDRRAAYDNYRIGMERLNIDREKAALAIKPIFTYEEWLASYNPTPVPAASAKPAGKEQDQRNSSLIVH